MSIKSIKERVNKSTPVEWAYDDGSFGAELPKKHSATMECYETKHFSWMSYPAQYTCDCGDLQDENDAELFINARKDLILLLEIAEAAKDYMDVGVSDLIKKRDRLTKALKAVEK